MLFWTGRERRVNHWPRGRYPLERRRPGIFRTLWEAVEAFSVWAAIVGLALLAILQMARQW